MTIGTDEKRNITLVANSWTGTLKQSAPIAKGDNSVVLWFGSQGGEALHYNIYFTSFLINNKPKKK